MADIPTLVTSTPRPIPTGILGPSDWPCAHPHSCGNATNSWRSVVGDVVTQVFAGAPKGKPEQGLVVIEVSQLTPKFSATPVPCCRYAPDPEPGGALDILSVDGNIMTLQRENGTTVQFDLSTKWFVGYPTPTAVPPPTATPGPAASFSIQLSSSTVALGGQFSIAILQDSELALSGAQTDFSFDPNLAQISSVELGDAYQGALLVYGVAPDLGAAAIVVANRAGSLPNIAAFFVPGMGTVTPAGQNVFLKIHMQADAGRVERGYFHAAAVQGGSAGSGWRRPICDRRHRRSDGRFCGPIA